MRSPVLLLVLAGLTWAGNGCVAIANGYWNAPSTWTSCGGSYPGLSDTAVIGYTVTINANISITNITVTSGGRLQADGVAPHSITIDSTGTAWQTNMFGIVLCGGSTLDFTAATLANYLTIGSFGNAYPYAIASVTEPSGACTSYGDPTIKLAYTSFQSPCGSQATSVYCINNTNFYYENPGLVVTNSVFVGAYQPIAAYGLGAAVSIQNNLFENSSCAPFPPGIVYDDGPAPGSLSFSSNTAMSPAGNCAMFWSDSTPSGAVTMSQNGWFDNATYTGNLFSFDGAAWSLASPFTAQLNVLGSVNANSRCGQAPGSADASEPVIWKQNVSDGCVFTSYSYGSYIDSSFNRNVTGVVNNIYQGSGSEILASGPVNTGTVSSYDSTVMLGNNSGNDGIFWMGSSAVLQSPVVNHATIIMTLPDSEQSCGIQFGEAGAGYYNTLGTIKNSLVTGASVGIKAGNPAGTFSTACSWGGGACNNLTPPALTSCPMVYGCGNADCVAGTRPASCGNLAPYYPSNALGENFDNGIAPHPSITYGDSTANPVFADPFRNLAKYDSLMGGPGTMVNVANCLALYNTPLAAVAGVTCVGSPSNYAPFLLWNYLNQGIRPLQISLATGADDGTQYGAVGPICLGCMM